MFSRHLVHVAAGILMAAFFTWSLRGIAAAALLALVSPVVTLASFRGLSAYRQLSEAERMQRRIDEGGWSDFIWGYLGRAGWYTVVTLVVAQVARSQIAG